MLWSKGLEGPRWESTVTEYSRLRCGNHDGFGWLWRALVGLCRYFAGTSSVLCRSPGELCQASGRISGSFYLRNIPMFQPLILPRNLRGFPNSCSFIFNHRHIRDLSTIEESSADRRIFRYRLPFSRSARIYAPLYSPQNHASTSSSG